MEKATKIMFGLAIALATAVFFTMSLVWGMLFEWQTWAWAMGLAGGLVIMSYLAPLATGAAVNWIRRVNNRRVMIIGILAMICTFNAGRNVFRGESPVVHHAKEVHQAVNVAMEYYGYNDWVVPVPLAPSTSHFPGFLRWATILWIVFLLYGPWALRDNIALAYRQLERRLEERSQRLRETEALTARREAGKAGDGGGTQPSFRFGAALGTLMLILEFLGDVFLHGGLVR